MAVGIGMTPYQKRTVCEMWERIDVESKGKVGAKEVANAMGPFGADLRASPVAEVDLEAFACFCKSLFGSSDRKDRAGVDAKMSQLILLGPQECLKHEVSAIHQAFANMKDHRSYDSYQWDCTRRKCNIENPIHKRAA